MRMLSGTVVVQMWSLQNRRDPDLLESIWSKAPKTISGMEHLLGMLGPGGTMGGEDHAIIKVAWKEGVDVTCTPSFGCFDPSLVTGSVRRSCE